MRLGKLCIELETRMDQLLAFFLKNGLKPLFIEKEINDISKKVTRSELIALIMIKQRGQSSMSQLATDMGMPLSTVTNIRQRLKKRELIEQSKDANDQRVILIGLTSDGEMLADKVLAIMNRVLEKIKETLSSEELNQLIMLMLKVMNAVQTTHQEEKEEHSTLRRIEIEKD